MKLKLRRRLHILKHRFRTWTLLPGDPVYDFLRQLQGVVIAVPRLGRANVAWTSAESLYHYPAESRAALEGAGPMTPAVVFPVVYSGPVVWREDDVDAFTLGVGRRY